MKDVASSARSRSARLGSGRRARLNAAARLSLLLLAALGCLPLSANPPATGETRAEIVLVLGAPGEPEFGTNFLQQAELWGKAAAQAGAPLTVVGTDPESATPSDRERLEQRLAALRRDAPAPLWLVLVGHGTFDGQEARFNLRGPDLTAADLAAWLRPFQRPLVLINTASASAPFLNQLSAPRRIVITATRSGNELNFTRFGLCLAQSLADPAADLDQDGQASLLECFLRAAHLVAEFYKTEGRLATEHALLDDNGDKLGTPADWFRGLRATKPAAEGKGLDGRRAHGTHLSPGPEEMALSPEQRARRDALETELEALRERKNSLKEADYYDRLERILLELAWLQVPASSP